MSEAQKHQDSQVFSPGPFSVSSTPELHWMAMVLRCVESMPLVLLFFKVFGHPKPFRTTNRLQLCLVWSRWGNTRTKPRTTWNVFARDLLSSQPRTRLDVDAAVLCWEAADEVEDFALAPADCGSYYDYITIFSKGFWILKVAYPWFILQDDPQPGFTRPTRKKARDIFEKRASRRRGTISSRCFLWRFGYSNAINHPSNWWLKSHP